MWTSRAVAVALLAGALGLSACSGAGERESLAPALSPASSSDVGPAGSANLGGAFARATPLPPTVSCQYPAAGKAAKPNSPPPTTDVPSQGAAAVALQTSNGIIGLTLDRQLAPCSINNFLSLAKQGYFDDTPCHRLVTSGIYVLQCGDPTGTGTGGPGYVFDNEYPTDQYPANDSRLTSPVNYPSGTVAMANTGKPNSNGSQFFLVYKDSPLPPQYTVLGTIDAPGLAVIDKIAAGGDDGSLGSNGGGAPKTPVRITKAVVG